MKFVPIKSFLLIIFVFSVGCVFSPKDKYVSPIQPPEPIQVFIDVNDPNFTDPYYLVSTGYFYFTFKELDLPVIDYQATIGNLDLSPNFQNNTLSFILFPHMVSTGSHTVSIKIKVATRSGSLAEKLGLEYYLLEKKFTLIIDPVPPKAVNIKADLENGYLVYRWDNPGKSNYYYYFNKMFQSAYSSDYSEFSINNSQVYHYLDSGFVGGALTLKVLASSYSFLVDLAELTYELKPMDVIFNVDNQNILHLGWDNIEINTSETELQVTADNFNINQPLTVGGDIPLDTIVLGDELFYTLRISRKGFERFMYTEQVVYRPEPNIKAFDKATVLNVNNKLLLLSQDNLYRFNLDGFVLEDSISVLELGVEGLVDLVISEDEKKAFIASEGSSLLFKLDPLNFNSIEKIELEGITDSLGIQGEALTELLLGNCTNSGILTFIIKKGVGSLYVYDSENNRLIWGRRTYSYTPPIVSEDGMKLIVGLGDNNSFVFDRQGDAYVRSGTVATGKYYFDGDGVLISLKQIGANKISYFENPVISYYNFLEKPARDTWPYSKIEETTVENENEYGDLIGIEYDRNSKLIVARYVKSSSSVLITLDKLGLEVVNVLKSKQTSKRSHIYSGGYHLNDRGYIEVVE